MSKANYGVEYQNHLLDQYKLYVEMADRISARRVTTSRFFVAANTTFTIAFTVLLKKEIIEPDLRIGIPLAALLLLCWLWNRVIHSYQQLNAGKFEVVKSLEHELPSTPYGTEWKILGEGNDKDKYNPVTDLEKWVPLCFALLYLSLAISFYLIGSTTP